MASFTSRFAATAALFVLTLAGCMTAPAPPSGPWLDFATLAPGKSSNSALACASDLCPLAVVSRAEFQFNASAERVAAALQSIEPAAQIQTEPAGDILIAERK